MSSEDVSNLVESRKRKRKSKAGLEKEIEFLDDERRCGWWYYKKDQETLCRIYGEIKKIRLTTKNPELMFPSVPTMECPCCGKEPDTNWINPMKITIASCGHVYCAECIKVYKRDHDTCKKCMLKIMRKKPNTSI